MINVPGRADTVSTPSDHPSPRVIGVIVTFRRPQQLKDSLERLFSQSLLPHLIHVIDNAPSEESESVILGLSPQAITIEYHAMPGNAGPAGGFAYAIGLLERESDDSLVVLVDDDDPPASPEIISRLVETMLNAERREVNIGGVGLRGGTLKRNGRIQPMDAQAPAPVLVDHLHGGFSPMYRLGALRSVNGPDSSFFFGYEELELGRRLRSAGYILLADPPLLRVVSHRYAKIENVSMSRLREPEESWKIYHKERNLLRILIRERMWRAVVETILLRYIASSVLGHLRLRGRSGTYRSVKLGLWATFGALSGEVGRSARFRVPE